MTHARALMCGVIVIICAGVGFAPDSNWKVLLFIQLPLCCVAGRYLAKLGTAAQSHTWLPPLHEVVFEIVTLATLFVSRTYNNMPLTVLGGAMLGVLMLAADRKV